jgi:quercetin dioxygenase-like cupin family protein
MRHVVLRASDERYEIPTELNDHSSGLTRWSMIDHTTPGAVHTGFGVSKLDGGGRVEAHVHSFEESFYVLEGSVIVETPEATVELVPGDYGMIPIGLPHAWRNESGEEASWADLMTPQPRPWFDGEQYLLKAGDVAFAGVGAVHAFNNATETTVRWLETQAPGPPARHSYRFARDWDYLSDRLNETNS